MELGKALDRFDLTGRVALVTGASSWGIGSASAELLAKAGAKVFIVARREDKLKEVAEGIEADGGIAAYKKTDVRNAEECKAAVEACVEKFGRLDIMVLNAGISGLPARDLESEFDLDNWRNMQSTNLDGEYYFLKYGYRECAKHGVGSIVCISSLAALKALGSSSYTATKGAIKSMTRHFGKSFAKIGVRINAIYPGMIDTDMTHMAIVTEQYWAPMRADIPMDCAGDREDIAYGVLYLASDASKFMTGQDLVIDGGQTC